MWGLAEAQLSQERQPGPAAAHQSGRRPSAGIPRANEGDPGREPTNAGYAHTAEGRSSRRRQSRFRKSSSAYLFHVFLKLLMILKSFRLIMNTRIGRPWLPNLYPQFVSAYDSSSQLSVAQPAAQRRQVFAHRRDDLCFIYRQGFRAALSAAQRILEVHLYRTVELRLF